MKKSVYTTMIAIVGLGMSSAAFAAQPVRATATNYAAPSAKPAVGTRAGASMGRSSKLDDTGTTIIVAAAAGVGGYFLHDIIDDDDNDHVSGE